MSVTIKDVAKKAGVSVATVSRVLNHSPAVLDKTCERVNAVIAELGYSPNFLGRNLRKRETNKILAIIPSTEHSFYSEILRGLQETAFPDYDVVICSSYSSFDTEYRLLGMLFNCTADAAVLLGTQMSAEILEELDSRYSIALCCERVDGAGLLTVTIDDERGAYDAVTALAAKGHKRIGMINASNKALSSADRERGYRKALEAKGIPFDEKLIYHGMYDFDDGSKGYEKLISLDDPPTAIFCISDILAAGAVHSAAEHGLRAGNDIDIMGFDNTFTSRIYLPGITTVAQPCYEMGCRTMKLLLENMSGREKHRGHVVMPHTLISRQSAVL